MTAEGHPDVLQRSSLFTGIRLRIPGFQVHVLSQAGINTFLVSLCPETIHCLLSFKKLMNTTKSFTSFLRDSLGSGDFSYIMQSQGITFHHSQKAMGRKIFMCFD